MVMAAAARRPGLALAASVWLTFVALAAVALEEAVTTNGSARLRVFAAANGVGLFPSFCLVVAAMLVLVEQQSVTTDEPAVRLLARLVQAAAVAATGMTAAGVVVLPTWSRSTSADEWVVAISPYLTSLALSVLAAMLAAFATRPVPVQEVAG